MSDIAQKIINIMIPIIENISKSANNHCSAFSYFFLALYRKYESKFKVLYNISIIFSIFYKKFRKC